MQVEIFGRGPCRTARLGNLGKPGVMILHGIGGSVRIVDKEDPCFSGASFELEGSHRVRYLRTRDSRMVIYFDL